MKKYLGMFIIILLTGCAWNPVLYPNTHLTNVGNEQAKQDIEDCRQQADAYVKSDAAKEAVKDTGIGGAGVGGAIGAVNGSFGRGVEMGAAGGAAAGLVGGIIKSTEPDPLYKTFVNRCLNEKGYDIIGWQ